MIKKIINWFKRQSPTIQGMIIVGILCVIGIILRWDFIVEQATKSINFYK